MCIRDRSRTTYEMVLPPEAVRMDNKGSYVLRVEQTQTILCLLYTSALDTAAKAYEKSKQETGFQNRQNNLDAQTAALDIEKQQAVVDALAALAENRCV